MSTVRSTRLSHLILIGLLAATALGSFYLAAAALYDQGSVYQRSSQSPPQLMPGEMLYELAVIDLRQSSAPAWDHALLRADDDLTLIRNAATLDARPGPWQLSGATKRHKQSGFAAADERKLDL